MPSGRTVPSFLITELARNREDHDGPVLVDRVGHRRFGQRETEALEQLQRPLFPGFDAVEELDHFFLERIGHHEKVKVVETIGPTRRSDGISLVGHVPGVRGDGGEVEVDRRYMSSHKAEDALPFTVVGWGHGIPPGRPEVLEVFEDLIRLSDNLSMLKRLPRAKEHVARNPELARTNTCDLGNGVLQKPVGDALRLDVNICENVGVNRVDVQNRGVLLNCDGRDRGFVALVDITEGLLEKLLAPRLEDGASLPHVPGSSTGKSTYSG